MVPGGYKAEQGQSTQPAAITQVETPALESLRVILDKYIEPASGDVDIAKEPILVSVGRGIQNKDNIILAEDLAKALGGTVSGSRPVIDQGWLATSRLVGKSGKSVKPKIYLALGISGAPEHVEGITDSDTIIAINTDPAAPIFGVAKYGSEIDLFDLIEVLTRRSSNPKVGRAMTYDVIKSILCTSCLADRRRDIPLAGLSAALGKFAAWSAQRSFQKMGGSDQGRCCLRSWTIPLVPRFNPRDRSLLHLLGIPNSFPDHPCRRLLRD